MLSTRGGVAHGEAGREDFGEGEAERNVLVGRGVRFIVAVFPIIGLSAPARLCQMKYSVIASPTTERQSTPHAHSPA